MKASELIKQLQTVMGIHGDLSVTVDIGDEDLDDIAGIAVGHDEQDHPQHFLICDRDTLDAFHD